MSTTELKRKSNGRQPVKHWWDDFFDGGPFWGTPGFRYQEPAVNIKDAEDRYEIEVACPGFSKEDFKVELHNGVLSIAAESQKQEEENAESYTRKEFSYQSFNRAFTVPDDAIEESVSAAYKDGVLKIVLKRLEDQKADTARKIDIQ